MQTPTAQPAAARYYETRQQVAIATGHLLDGIRSELARERLIGPGDARLARSELLAQLRAAAERGVSLAPPPGSDATVRGWLEAASVAVDNARNPTLGATRLAAFRARLPVASGARRAVGRTRRRHRGAGGQPRSRAARRAHAAAHRAHVGARGADSRRLHDRVLPGAGRNAPAPARLRHRDHFDRRHHGAGACGRRHFIVGPLTREEVVAAGELLTTRPPILALNFLPADRPTPERYYQFALSPEDDARAVARYIGATGKRRGVVLTPEGDWGTRVAAAFDEELRAAGGFLLGQASFGATTRNDFTDSIMQVLRTDDSRTRHQRIQATIGQKLDFEPRRRPDIQFIFAPSQPGAARQLRPQLAFPSRRRHSHLHAWAMPTNRIPPPTRKSTA